MNTEEFFNKSRYGRISSKKKFNEEEQESETSRTLIGNLHTKNKRKLSSSVSNGINVNMQNEKSNGYGIGDIVWAKTGKYPIWPAIITDDPESKKFTKKENNNSFFHIVYCNDGFKRNWMKVNQIFTFLNRKRVLIENPKIMAQITRSKLKLKWSKAVDDAEFLASMSNRVERIQAFYNDDLPIKQELTENHHQVNNSRKSKEQLRKSNSSETSASTSQSLTDEVSVKVKQDKNKPSLPMMPTVIVKAKQDKKEPNISVMPTQSYPKDHPRILIPELCKLFYDNGWVTGTGGGISIKYNNLIYIAPSGVQKERMEPEDLFVQDIIGEDIQLPPIEKNLSKSQCTPIFMCSYIERDAGAVIHIHSPDIVKLSFFNPENELRISSGLEMVKGIYNEEKKRFYDNDEEVVIPIIENSKYERDLVDTFKETLLAYPSTSAILVRNHGMYVWGKDWKSAKTQCECYAYVINIMLFKKIHKL